MTNYQLGQWKDEETLPAAREISYAVLTRLLRGLLDGGARFRYEGRLCTVTSVDNRSFDYTDGRLLHSISYSAFLNLVEQNRIAFVAHTEGRGMWRLSRRAFKRGTAETP